MKQLNELQARRERTRILLESDYLWLDWAMSELLLLVASLPDPQPGRRAWWARLWETR